MHYGMLVVLDPKPIRGPSDGFLVPAYFDEVKRRVDRLLSPYYEQEWDWYQLGGRWTGQLDPFYDPEADPRNSETCLYCKGTGSRRDKVGLEALAADPLYTCNGCSGKGTKVRWPTEWVKNPTDIQPLPYTKLTVEELNRRFKGIVSAEGGWEEGISRLPDRGWLVIVDVHN